MKIYRCNHSSRWEKERELFQDGENGNGIFVGIQEFVLYVNFN